MIMLPSIKESDRYTSEDRMGLAVGGILVTVIAAGLNLALYEAGYYAPYFIVLFFVGLIVMGSSCFVEYHGNIVLTDPDPEQVQRVCPSCQTQGLTERYEEKVGEHTERQYRVVYTHVKRTQFWAKRIHCRACGFKAHWEQPAARPSNRARVGVGVPPLLVAVQSSDDPFVKAKAILEASKPKAAKKREDDVYAKLDTNEPAVPPVQQHGQHGELELSENDAMIV